MIVLDTHTLVWSAEDAPRLGRRATRLTDAALKRDEVFVSAITFWEIAMLQQKRRLTLDVTPAAFRTRALEQGVREVPVSSALGIAATELTGIHQDPADRIIVATALSLGATLLTADRVLLDGNGPLRTLDATH